MAIPVIDTDVWSYLYKGRDEAKLYEPHLLGNILVISFQTEAEICAARLPPIGESNAVSTWNRDSKSMSSNLRRMRCQCVGPRRWTALARNGWLIAAADAWIAATALLLDVPLITHNRNHFVGVDGLTIVSER
jgi:tRNA(fMet)-specific endonuclease VapC